MPMSDITRFRGDTIPIVFNVTSNGVAVDITSWSFTLTIDPSTNPADAAKNVLQLTGTLTAPLTGEVTFTMTALQADIAPGTYHYDVQGTDGAGVIRTFGVAKFVIDQDITKV
jgi:hypothetical protein